MEIQSYDNISHDIKSCLLINMKAMHKTRGGNTLIQGKKEIENDGHQTPRKE